MNTQKTAKTNAATLLIMVLLCSTANLFAVELTWNVTDGAFADGGTFNGSFQFDAQTQVVSDWNLPIAGGDTTLFPAITMTPQNSSVAILNFSNSQDTFQFVLSDNSNRQLRFTPETALTDAGGVIALNLNTLRGGSGGLECYDCFPARVISSGQLSNGNVPNPAGLSGLWFDPALEGEGYNVINAGNGMIVYFYGYTAGGRRLWLLSELYTQTIRFDETIHLGITEFKGGLFSQPLDSRSAASGWGTLSVNFSSCNAATFILSGVDGQKTSNAVKLAGIAGTDC